MLENTWVVPGESQTKEKKMPPTKPHIYGEEFGMLSLWCNILILSSWGGGVLCI